MSDVSKTTPELIAEAGRWIASQDSQHPDSLVRDLRDALESATRVPEQGEVSAAFVRVRAALAAEVAWHGHLKESGESVPRHAIGIGVIERALDGAPEPVSVRCGGCRDLGPHNYGPGCEYRQKGESE